MYPGDKVSDNFEVRSNLFAKFFISVYTDYTDQVPADTSTLNTTVDIQSMHISRESIFEKLKNLDVNKSVGPDNIPFDSFVHAIHLLSNHYLFCSINL